MTQAHDKATGTSETNGQSGGGGWTPEEFRRYKFAKFLGRR